MLSVMITHGAALRAFLGAMFSGYSRARLIGGLALFIGFVAIRGTQFDGRGIIAAYGPGLLVGWFLLSAYLATHKAISSHYATAEENFYAASREARLERLHRLIYDLYREGQKLPAEDDEARQKWDRQTCTTLTKYGGAYLTQNYLTWTGRYDGGPMTAEQMDSTINLLEQWLDGDFFGYME